MYELNNKAENNWYIGSKKKIDKNKIKINWNYN